MKLFASTAVLLLCLAGNATPSDSTQNAKTNAAEIAAILAIAQPKCDSVLEEAIKARSAFGFEADDDLSQAVVGDPIPVYTVDETDACDFCEGDKVESVLKESGQWLVPITINGTVRTFVKITKTSDNGTNQYVASMGSTAAAKVWRVILDRWPAKENFHPKLVMYPRIPGYFFTIPEVNPQNMTDIVRILAEVDNKPTALSPASVIIHSWQ